jgi:OHCU decarboxylase
VTPAASSRLDWLNELPRADAEGLLLSCCGSREWARRLSEERPFGSAEDLAEASDRIWRSLPKADWREAFGAHPRIGEKGTGSFDQKRGLSPFWSREEQAGTATASTETLANLAEANREYEERFGHIFIVCASGKSAAEMLALAQSRLHNDSQTELEIAAEEQRKITRLRLAKLLEAEGA